MENSIIGILAAFLTTICSIPQIYYIYSTKNVSAISLECYVILWVGVGLWLLHGLTISDNSMVIGNILSLCGTSTIIFFKIKYGVLKKVNNNFESV